MDTEAVAWGDWNNDGWSDLFGRQYLWTNNGDGSFTRTSPFGSFAGCPSVSLGDFNNDGDFDIYVSNFAHPGNPSSREKGEAPNSAARGSLRPK